MSMRLHFRKKHFIWQERIREPPWNKTLHRALPTARSRHADNSHRMTKA